MKRIIIAVISIQLLGLPVFSSGIIEDSFAEKSLQGKSVEFYKPPKEEIKDELVDKYLKNLEIVKIETVKIEDDFLIKQLSDHVILNGITATDDFDAQPFKANIKYQDKQLSYDFESIKQIPVKISILKGITTRTNLREGEELSFQCLSDVHLGDNLDIKKGSIVKARLETVSKNSANGVPADIIIGNFKTTAQNDKEILLDGNIRKIGANRALWVYPSAQVLSTFFLVGYLLFAIRGGHAKIKPKDVYEIYYMPN